jgi:glycerophosphoryl diester phosphodiesterase
MFVSTHRRTLGWLAVLLVTGWLPLLAAGVVWWEFKDEIYPAVRIYEAPPADKLDRLLAGQGPPLVFSHRGDHLFSGQNSFESFQRSIERGYDGIELDVTMAADDVPVIAHSFTLRDDDTSLFVPEATSTEIRALADGLPAEQGARFRTLDETLERFANKTLLIVEFKAKKETSFGAEAPVCELVKKHDATQTVILSSLKYHVLETLENTPACEGISRMYEVSGTGGDPPDSYNLALLGMRHDLLAERKGRAPKSVRAFSVYTTNRAHFISRAIEDGALLVQTDRPGRAMRIRDEMVDW